jgi:hypothetical protein
MTTDQQWRQFLLPRHHHRYERRSLYRHVTINAIAGDILTPARFAAAPGRLGCRLPVNPTHCTRLVTVHTALRIYRHISTFGCMAVMTGYTLQRSAYLKAFTRGQQSILIAMNFGMRRIDGLPGTKII